jgi:hypothetical protein
VLPHRDQGSPPGSVDRTRAPFLAGLPQGPEKFEETSGLPLRLPRQGRSLASTPPASRPQRSGLAAQLRFTQPLFVTLFGKLEIHHLMHTRLSSLIGSLCPFSCILRRCRIPLHERRVLSDRQRGRCLPGLVPRLHLRDRPPSLSRHQLSFFAVDA